VDEFVLDSLVIASMPVVVDEDRNGFVKVCFTEEDETAQALRFDGTNKAFRKGVALRNARRAKDDLNAGRFESLPKAINVLGIAVDNQVRLAQGEAVHGVNKLTSSLSHPFRVGRHRSSAHILNVRRSLQQPVPALGPPTGIPPSSTPKARKCRANLNTERYKNPEQLIYVLCSVIQTMVSTSLI
jgi:hypothetical protein